MKTALICDWLTGMRGGERCLKAVADLYPQADLFTLVYFPEKFQDQFEDHTVETSFIQKLPGSRKHFRYYLPLFPAAVESFDLSAYDLVVSFSHCVAKGAKASRGVPHLCYCHTPMRYAWDLREEYLKGMDRLRRGLTAAVLRRLSQWDRQSAARVTEFIANSRNIQQKIRRFYGRPSQVIYPPVDLQRFQISNRQEDYFLVLSALVPYKRLDIAVEAFNQTGRRLVVAGSGPEYRQLRALAKDNIEFVIAPDDKTVEKLYAGCRALIFPGEEDFGIVPLEAQACGKPVIAYQKGGALETVVPLGPDEPAPTGLFFSCQSVPSLRTAVEEFERNAHSWSPESCRRNAEGFGVERYQAQMQAAVEAVTAGDAGETRQAVYRSAPVPSSGG